LPLYIRFFRFGGLYVGEFAERGREVNVRVDGQLIVNGIDQMVQALDGVRLAYALEDIVAGYVEDGRLVQVLQTGARASRATTCTIQAAGSVTGVCAGESPRLF
jgi:hypothetical protein